MREEVFNTELNRIQDEDVRESARIILSMLPDYFYIIPASSSGKYHPKFALGPQGLVKHVKAAMLMLEKMFTNELFGVYDSYTKDLIRMALIIHDGFKSGYTNSGRTCSEHPVLMADFLLKNKDKFLIPEEDIEFVASLVKTHMGPWNTDYKGNVIMPKPNTSAELLVHYADYFASFPFINIEFNGLEIVTDFDRSKVNKKTK